MNKQIHVKVLLKSGQEIIYVSTEEEAQITLKHFAEGSLRVLSGHSSVEGKRWSFAIKGEEIAAIHTMHIIQQKYQGLAGGSGYNN